MIQKEEFLYKDETYTLLLSEQDNLLKAILNQEQQALYFSDTTHYVANFYLETYNLMLHSISNIESENNNVSDNLSGTQANGAFSMEDSSGLSVLLPCTGGIIIAKDFVESFGNEDIFPGYCYRKVIELIFKEGILITSIDHSKAMLKIRKNIVKGLRDIHNKRDNRCIRKFMKESLVGNYTKTMKKKIIRSRISKLINHFKS